MILMSEQEMRDMILTELKRRGSAHSFSLLMGAMNYGKPIITASQANPVASDFNSVVQQLITEGLITESSDGGFRHVLTYLPQKRQEIKAVQDL